MSKEVHVYDLYQFDNDVAKYIQLNKENGFNYYPKLHHLENYSMFIKEFGSLSNYSTLRFGKFHQKGKRSVRNSESKKTTSKLYKSQHLFFFIQIFPF